MWRRTAAKSLVSLAKPAWPPGEVDQRRAEAFGERGTRALGELAHGCDAPGGSDSGGRRLQGSDAARIHAAAPPLGADPSDAPAAFAEYAANAAYTWTHLGQFTGFSLLGAALLALAATLESGRASAWGRIGWAGTVASVAVAAVLQAVDGVALKVIVDRWVAAAGEARVLAFEAAFAVRQIEIGLAAYLSFSWGCPFGSSAWPS